MAVTASMSVRQALGLQLPPALQLHILSFLPPNDRALSGRLVSPDAAAGLSGPRHFTARLYKPLPPHAVPWAVEAGQQHVRQLPFRHKLQLLCTAAESGSEANLEVALALLQPSVFPELLYQDMRKGTAYPNPGVAAVEAGHPQLLGWLLRHCPALLADRRAILMAAARHCDLAGLQAAWAALGCSNSMSPSSFIDQNFLDGFAASRVDGKAKLEWVLAEGRGSCSLQESTAAAAARSGDLGRLRWLRDRGCPVDLSTLESALQHADLAVADWLVDEAGCKLPAASGEEGQWKKLLAAAVMSPDGVAKLQWLQQRGAPPLGGDSNLLPRLGYNERLICLLLDLAAMAGRVEVAQHLLSISPPAARQQLLADSDLPYYAVASGSVPMLEFLRQARCTASGEAYAAAWQASARSTRIAADDCIAMFWWLVREAKVPAAKFNLLDLLSDWPNDTLADRRGLLEAVQLLVGEAGCRGWDARMALITAAKRGDLALVQNLLQQRPGHQPGWKVLDMAAYGGCEVLLEWLVEQHPGCLAGAGSGESVYVLAAACGDLGTLTALRRLGVPWGAKDTVVEALWRGCSVPALRWLVGQGMPVGCRDRLDDEVTDAVRCGSVRAEDAAWVRSLGGAQ